MSSLGNGEETPHESEDTVSRWLARARHGGPEALLARPAPGHPPKLSSAQKRLIPEFLWHGPEAYVNLPRGSPRCSSQSA
jgi:hypothetical protein